MCCRRREAGCGGVRTSEGRRDTRCRGAGGEGGRGRASVQRGVCDGPPPVVLEELKGSKRRYGVPRAHGWRRRFRLKGTAGGASIGRFGRPFGAGGGCVAVCGRRGHGCRYGGARGREGSAAQSLSTDNMDVQRQERVATTPDNHVANATEPALMRLHCLIPITFPLQRSQSPTQPSYLRLPSACLRALRPAVSLLCLSPHRLEASLTIPAGWTPSPDSARSASCSNEPCPPMRSLLNLPRTPR